MRDEKRPTRHYAIIDQRETNKAQAFFFLMDVSRDGNLLIITHWHCDLIAIINSPVIDAHTECFSMWLEDISVNIFCSSNIKNI